MGAEPFGAVFAVQSLVTGERKAFGVTEERDLPIDQDPKRECRDQIGERRGKEKKRRTHHGVIPVVDATARAAAVLQKPAPDRTEKENADRVADRVYEKGEEENASVKDPEKAKHAEKGIEADPDGGDRKGAT